MEELRAVALAARRAIGGVHAPLASALASAARCNVLRSRLTAATTRLNDEVAAGVAARAAIAVLRTAAELRAASEARLREQLAMAYAQQATLLDRADSACADRDAAAHAAARVACRAVAERAVLDAKLKAADVTADTSAALIRVKAASVIAPMTALEIELLSELRAEETALRVAEAHAADAALRVDAYDAAFSVVSRDTGAESIAEVMNVWRANDDANWTLMTSTAALQAERDALANEARSLRVAVARAPLVTVAAAEATVRAAAAARGSESDAAAAVAAIERSPIMRQASAKARASGIRWTSLGPAASPRPPSLDNAATVAREAIGEAAAARAEVEKLRLATVELVAATGAGDADAITPANLLDALAAVERRANSILPAYTRLVLIAQGKGQWQGLAEGSNVSVCLKAPTIVRGAEGRATGERVAEIKL